MLDLPLEKKALMEVLSDIELRKEDIYLFDDRDSNPLLQQTDIPSGYVPAWIQYARNYREQALNTASNIQPENSHQDKVLTLRQEHPETFAIFVHWLYTGKLAIKKSSVELEWRHACLLVYALAERLDVPILRRKCYHKVIERCTDAASLPEIEMVRTLLDECFPWSNLRRYFVCLFAHAVISKSISEHDGKTLDAYPTFAQEVANEIMKRLRKDYSTLPFSTDEFQRCDTDPDVESDEWSSGTDSDYDMKMSDDEDRDSMFSDTPEPMEALTRSASEELVPDSFPKLMENGLPIGNIASGGDIEQDDGLKEGQVIVDVTKDSNSEAASSYKPVVRKKVLKRKSAENMESDKENRERGHPMSEIIDLENETAPYKTNYFKTKLEKSIHGLL